MAVQSSFHHDLAAVDDVQTLAQTVQALAVNVVDFGLAAVGDDGIDARHVAGVEEEGLGGGCGGQER